MFWRRGWILAGLMAIVLLGGVLWLRASPDLSQLWPVVTPNGRSTLLFVGLLALAVLTVAWWSSPWHHPIFAALGVVTPVIPGIAAVATTAVYLCWGENHAWKAVLSGILLALYCWWLLAFIYRRFVSVQYANPRIYRELSGRLDELQVHLELLKPTATASMTIQSAYGEACAHRDFLSRALDRDCTHAEADPGFHWVFATGYIDLWNRLHRAEEALIQMKPADMVVSGAKYDRWRLQGSGIENSAALLAQLDTAVKTLAAAREPANAPHLVDKDGTALAVGTEGERAILREVRHTLNEYRDGRWEGLARIRNRLVKTGLFTGLFAYILFSLAIVAGAGKAAIIGAAVYYLVGTSVGLFNQLLAEANTESAIEDYGLSSVRLLHIPLFSGFAALGGVFLTLLLPLLTTPADTSTSAMMDKMKQMFHLSLYPQGLIVAAMFGLTPRLLIDRLKQQTDRYTQELKTTQATGSTENRPDATR